MLPLYCSRLQEDAVQFVMSKVNNTFAATANNTSRCHSPCAPCSPEALRVSLLGLRRPPRGHPGVKGLFVSRASLVGSRGTETSSERRPGSGAALLSVLWLSERSELYRVAQLIYCLNKNIGERRRKFYF